MHVFFQEDGRKDNANHCIPKRSIEDRSMCYYAMNKLFDNLFQLLIDCLSSLLLGIIDMG